ncbi:MAG: SH3 domain-containing protein [Saprospiraceae bacterium]|nr:SH3 domain-containing protein [Saprospiraceae bacterium]
MYVTIDGLNVRSTPGLKGQVLDRLALYDEVFFLNERTDSLYEFSIGKVKVKEAYVKIRTRKGRTGWVYGAGVHYYKMKREGAE